MENKFYIRIRGVVQGPFAEDELKALARRGRFGRMHEISQNGTAWSRAEDFPHLFLAATPSTSDEAAVSVDSQETSNPDSLPVPFKPIEPTSSTVGADWYYACGDQRHGPVDFATLQEKARIGELLPTDLVWRRGTPEWLPVALVPELDTGHFVNAAASPRMTDPDTPHQKTSAYAVASLMLGLLWLLGIGSALGILFGFVAIKSIRASRGRLTGNGLAVGGIVTGVLSLTITVAFVAVYLTDTEGAAQANRSSGQKNGDGSRRTARVDQGSAPGNSEKTSEGIIDAKIDRLRRSFEQAQDEFPAIDEIAEAESLLEGLRAQLDEVSRTNQGQNEVLASLTRKIEDFCEVKDERISKAREPFKDMQTEWFDLPQLADDDRSELVTIHVLGERKCDLDLLGAWAITAGNKELQLKPPIDSDVRRWDVVLENELIGTFELNGTAFSFSWGSNATSVAHADRLRYCGLRISAGTTSREVKLRRPHEVSLRFNFDQATFLQTKFIFPEFLAEGKMYLKADMPEWPLTTQKVQLEKINDRKRAFQANGLILELTRVLPERKYVIQLTARPKASDEGNATPSADVLTFEGELLVPMPNTEDADEKETPVTLDYILTQVDSYVLRLVRGLESRLKTKRDLENKLAQMKRTLTKYRKQLKGLSKADGTYADKIKENIASVRKNIEEDEEELAKKNDQIKGVETALGSTTQHAERLRSLKATPFFTGTLFLRYERDPQTSYDLPLVRFVPALPLERVE